MPTTTDGKKFDYSKLGMMKAKMHQQMLDKNKKSMGKKNLEKIPDYKSGIRLDTIFTFKANDPNNTQNRVPPYNKEFWKKPYGRSSN